MARRKYSHTSELPVCRNCGDECDREVSIRIDAPLIDPSFPVGARFILCSADCARQATGRKE